jgi:hypothetical protein
MLDTITMSAMSSANMVTTKISRSRMISAMAAGWGGITAVAGITGIARSTIGRGLEELRDEGEPAAAADRVRRAARDVRR